MSRFWEICDFCNVFLLMFVWLFMWLFMFNVGKNDDYGGFIFVFFWGKNRGFMLVGFVCGYMGVFLGLLFVNGIWGLRNWGW